MDALHKKTTIHQVATMLATSKKLVEMSCFQVITTCLPPVLMTQHWLSPEHQRVKGHQHQWIAGGYDLEIWHFYKWLAWWLPGG